MRALKGDSSLADSQEDLGDVGDNENAHDLDATIEHIHRK